MSSEALPRFTREEIEHCPDPIARMVIERWIREGKDIVIDKDVKNDEN